MFFIGYNLFRLRFVSKEDGVFLTDVFPLKRFSKILTEKADFHVDLEQQIKY